MSTSAYTAYWVALAKADMANLVGYVESARSETGDFTFKAFVDECGLDVNVRSSKWYTDTHNESTALLSMIELRCDTLVEELLALGADITAVDASGAGAVHVCFEGHSRAQFDDAKGCEQIMRILMAHDAPLAVQRYLYDDMCRDDHPYMANEYLRTIIGKCIVPA